MSFYRQGTLKAYVDAFFTVKKKNDTVHREVLWDLLRLRESPTKNIGQLTDLSSGTESAVNCGGKIVHSFSPMKIVMRLGCVLYPSLFNAYVD